MTCSIIDLEKQLSVLENLILNEGKQVGRLYHVCTLDDLAKYIAPTDTLSGSGNYKNYLKNSRTDIISFTRDKAFIVQTDKIRDTLALVQLEIDGDLLSHSKKILPYNDLAFDDRGKAIDEYQDEIQYREKEECVIGIINHLSKYLTGVRLYVSLRMLETPVGIWRVYNTLGKCYSYLEKVNASMFKSRERLLFERSVLQIQGKEGTMLIFNSVSEFKDILTALNSIIHGADVDDEQINLIFSSIKDPELLYNYVYYWFDNLSNRHLMDALQRYIKLKQSASRDTK